MSDRSENFQELVAEVAAAYFSNAPVSPSEIGNVIASISAALSNVGDSVGATDQAPVPAAAASAPAKKSSAEVRKSIRPDGLISFEDGKPYKTLKRHLSGRGLTPAEYRAKWGLPDDYPMVSPNYSAARSQMAKSIGLGQKGRGGQPNTVKTRGRGKAKAS